MFWLQLGNHLPWVPNSFESQEARLKAVRTQDSLSANKRT
jgi:hypothetical protein